MENKITLDPNETISSLVIDGIEFKDIKVNRLGTLLNGITEFVKDNNTFFLPYLESIKFNGINISNFLGNFFLNEYLSLEERANDITLLKKTFQLKLNNRNFSVKQENGRQIPELLGHFDYNGRYYVIVDGLNKLTDEINSEIGVCKGVIVNPSKYFETENETKKIAGNISGIIEK